MMVLYPNLCYNEMCYEGTALYSNCIYHIPDLCRLSYFYHIISLLHRPKP